MKSMTGFGQAQVNLAGVSIEISVKAINSRFLDVRCYLPREYTFLETKVKKAISSQMRRGTIDVYIRRTMTGDASAVQVRYQAGVAKQWKDSLQKLKKDLELKDEVTLRMLSQAPEVFKIDESNSVSKSESEAVLKTLEEASSACELEKHREGKALNLVVKDLLKELKSLVTKMSAVRKEANTELQKRLEQKWQALGMKTDMDPQRMAQEVIVMVDKADINEEVARLKEHIRAFGELLKSKDSIGKKMDFYSQELLREVNTIGSKSQVAQLTQLVVDAKATVERIREQVQNIE